MCVVIIDPHFVWAQLVRCVGGTGFHYACDTESSDNGFEELSIREREKKRE